MSGGARVYVCMCVCVYICMYVYVCMYVYIVAENVQENNLLLRIKKKENLAQVICCYRD